MVITLIICITIIILAAIAAVFHYLNTKIIKETEEFQSDIVDALIHISFYSDKIKLDDVFGDAKLYLSAIKDICKEFNDETE